MMRPFRRSPIEPLDGALFQVVVEFFEDDDWTFERIEGECMLSMGFAGQNGNWRCLASVNEELRQFGFFSVLDVRVPLERRSTAAEYLTRANYGLTLGNFELDFEDGEVRVKVSIDVEGGQLTPTMIKNLVYSNCAVTDRYLQGLFKVVFGDVEPELAIRDAEQAA